MYLLRDLGEALNDFLASQSLPIFFGHIIDLFPNHLFCLLRALLLYFGNNKSIEDPLKEPWMRLPYPEPYMVKQARSLQSRFL